MSDSNDLNIDINNLNIIELKKVMTKSPHMLKNLYSKIKLKEIVYLLYDFPNNKLQQVIYFLPNKIILNIFDFNHTNSSFLIKVLNYLNEDKIKFLAQNIKLDTAMDILLLLIDVDEYNLKLKTFYFNLNEKIQNYMKNKFNNYEIKILLNHLNNKFYIKNFLNDLDHNSNSFKYLITNILDEDKLNLFLYFMNSNQFKKSFSYINSSISFDILEKLLNNVRNNVNFSFTNLPPLTEVIIYLNTPSASKYILDILHKYNTNVLKIILPIISQFKIKQVISKLPLFKLTEVISILTPNQISNFINKIDVYYFEIIFPLLTKKQLFHSFKFLTNNKFWKAIEIISYDKLSIIIPNLSSHQIEIFLAKINSMNIDSMDIFIPYLSNQIISIMLSIEETKEIIINNFQYLNDDQIFYCIPMLDPKDLFSLLFLENNIDKVLLFITENQNDQLYNLILKKLKKNIKIFEELKLSLNIMKKTIDNLNLKIENLKNDSPDQNFIKEIDLLVNKISKNIRDFVQSRDNIYFELNIFNKLKFLYSNQIYIDKLNNFSIDVKYIFLEFKVLCNNFHNNGNSNNILNKWEKIKNKCLHK